MIFRETELAGAFLIEPERLEDERGFFARTWCAEEARAHGIEANWVQSNTSFNAQKGTLRGLHFQAAPREEAKLVRCTRGEIFDVIVDIRKDSPGFGKWAGFELSAQNGRALYIPQGFAHGFQSLGEASEVLYLMSEYYDPALSRGIRWDDPALGIAWPVKEAFLSEKDRSLPLLEDL